MKYGQVLGYTKFEAILAKMRDLSQKRKINEYILERKYMHILHGVGGFGLCSSMGICVGIVQKVAQVLEFFLFPFFF